MGQPTWILGTVTAFFLEHRYGIAEAEDGRKFLISLDGGCRAHLWLDRNNLRKEVCWGLSYPPSPHPNDKIRMELGNPPWIRTWVYDCQAQEVDLEFQQARPFRINRILAYKDSDEVVAKKTGVWKGFLVSDLDRHSARKALCQASKYPALAVSLELEVRGDDGKWTTCTLEETEKILGLQNPALAV